MEWFTASDFWLLRISRPRVMAQWISLHSDSITIHVPESPVGLSTANQLGPIVKKSVQPQDSYNSSKKKQRNF